MTDEAHPNSSGGWLNRVVLGAGLTSFLADVCYEMASAVLPSFLKILQLPHAAWIGVIEGFADATSNSAKLGVGYFSDRIGRRKPFVVAGYALTGVTQALFALAGGGALILLAKTLGWFGKGVRGPLRNAILSDAVAPGDRGKAFGLHRAGDTLGAVVGPLIAYFILRQVPAERFADPSGVYRFIFLLTLIPGIAAAVTFAVLIREKRHTAWPGLRFTHSLRAMPTGFRRCLLGIGVFGMGDFSDKLLLVAALTLLRPVEGEASALAFIPLLYAWRNTVQAIVAFPIGWAGDRFGHRRVLIAGYLFAVVVMVAFALIFMGGSATRGAMLILLALAGTYIAVEETLENAMTADLVPDKQLHGTAFGIMGTVNGIGDLAASVIVGLLMEFVSPIWAFGYAATMMVLGTFFLARVR
jgi:MFS family permease